MNRKPYIQPQPSNWWLKNPAYCRYMLREATAVPLFLYTLLLMSGIYQLTQGEEAFSHWLAALRTPAAVAFHTLAFAAALLHSWTWFELVPRILVIHTRRFRIDGSWIKYAHQGGALFCFVVLIGLSLWLFSNMQKI